MGGKQLATFQTLFFKNVGTLRYHFTGTCSIWIVFSSTPSKLCCTVRQAGWTICAQLEHSIRIREGSPLSSWLGSLQISHTADRGSPGWKWQGAGYRDIHTHTVYTHYASIPELRDSFYGWFTVQRARLTDRHCRSTQVCLSFPGPPNFFMSLQKLHSPHSDLIQASQRLHLQKDRQNMDEL